MTPGQVMFAVRIADERNDRDFDRMARAVQLGGASEEGWKQYYSED